MMAQPLADAPAGTFWGTLGQGVKPAPLIEQDQRKDEGVVLVTP